MKEEIRDLWVAALRSGEYAQTQKTLRNTFPQSESQPLPVGYCCLGVLCDLYAKETGDDRWVQIDSNWSPYSWEFDGVIGTPPDIVLNWAGLDSSTGKYRSPEGDIQHLTETNDKGATFAEIAKIIEEYF